jgi:hypothetical protein
MHGRLVGGGVAGNATGVFTIDVGLGLAEQALLLLRGRLGMRAAFEQQRSRDACGQHEKDDEPALCTALSRCGAAQRTAHYRHQQFRSLRIETANQ